MNRSGISAVEFRCLDRGIAKGLLTVQVLIDDVSLEERWNHAKGEWKTAAPLVVISGEQITPLDLWSETFDRVGYEGEYYEEGRTAVLTCSCDELLCGGVVARIDFTHEIVTWSDFRHANYLTPKEVGPFTFSSGGQYERALNAARRNRTLETRHHDGGS